jgi:hypothetical protein
MQGARYCRAALVALAVGFTGTLFTAHAAGAANDDGICNAGERCGWRNSNFGGSMADWGGGDSDFADEPGGDDAMYTSGGVEDVPRSGDRISSVRNRETFTIWFHADDTCGGDDTPLAAGAQLNTMPGGGGDVGDNEASSQAAATTC